MPRYDQIIVTNDRSQPAIIENAYFTFDALKTPKYQIFVDVQLLGIGIDRQLFRIRFLGRLTLSYNNQSLTAHNGEYDGIIGQLFGSNQNALKAALAQALVGQHAELVKVGGAYVAR